MSKIMHITTSFEVPDDVRTQGKIMAALDAFALALETAILEHAGVSAKVDMRVGREPKKTAGATPVNPDVVGAAVRQIAVVASKDAAE